MLFNSYIFVLLFLPLTIVGYFKLNKYKNGIWAKFFLLGMSLWFYGYFHIRYLLIIINSVVMNYFFYKRLKRSKKKNLRVFFLIVSVIFNIGMLFYFKYYDFFIENINVWFSKDFNLKNVLLPLGISFFTFQQLALIIDTYRGGYRSIVL